MHKSMFDVFEKIDSCGKSTVILEKNGTKFYKVFKCKEALCPTCSLVIMDNLQERMVYYVDTRKMHHFFTMTIATQDYKELNRIFKLICREMRMMDKDTFVKEYLTKNKKYTKDVAEQKYNEFMQNIIDYELKCHYLYEKEQEGQAKLITSLSIELSKLINSGKLLDWLKENKKLFSRRIYDRLVDTWDKDSKEFRGKTYASLSKSGKKYRLFNLFKEYYFTELDKFLEEESTKNKDFNNIKKDIETRIIKDINGEFSWVRTLEFQPNSGNPHFHIVSNYYFNYFITDKYKTEDSNVYKDIDFSLDEGFTKKDQADAISRYVTKYITKETLAVVKESKIDKKNNDMKVISASNGMSISLSYSNMEEEDESEDGGYKFIKKIGNKVPSESWGAIEGDLKAFESSLTNTEEELENAYMTIIHDKEKEIQRLISESRDKLPKEEYQDYKRKLDSEYKEFKMKYASKLIYEELDKRSKVKNFSIPFKNKTHYDSMTDKEQKEFVEAVSSDKYSFVMLSGKAGTGKTTSIKNALECLSFDGLKVEFVSFTGKAVSRISEVAGVEGKTIHRLANSAFSKTVKFLNNENNLIDADMVFIDEVGMLDKLVFGAFVNALKKDAKIIMIGDNNQLNPVQSNNLFYEFGLIKDSFENIKYVELQNNYRSADGINEVAMDVLGGNLSKINFEPFSIEKIIEDSANGYQAIVTSNELMRSINKQLTKDKKDITETAKYNYNIGDKVLILRNDKRNGVYNGDLAIIKDFDGLKIVLEKDGKEFRYSLFKSARCFQPYDCFTVHKSQGSEFEKISIVLDDKSMLLNNNILYTAITRAKKEFKVYVVEGVNTELLKGKQINEDLFTLKDAEKEYLPGLKEMDCIENPFLLEEKEEIPFI